MLDPNHCLEQNLLPSLVMTGQSHLFPCEKGKGSILTSDMVMFQFVSKADRLLSKPDLQT